MRLNPVILGIVFFFTEEYIRADQPLLVLPYKTGEFYMCTQGTNMGPSHLRQPFVYALDFGMPSNKDIAAAADGMAYVHVGNNSLNGCGRKCDQGTNKGKTCTSSEECPGGSCKSGNFGNHVNIDHGNGFFTLYAHLQKFLIPQKISGHPVKRGDLIGIEDSTGYSCGDHLHFGLQTGDPRKDAIQSVSVDAERILVKDRSKPEEGIVEIRSGDFRCGDPDGQGHWYESVLPSSGPNPSTTTYTEPSTFEAALTQSSTTTYDDIGSATAVPNGGKIDAITYTFNISGGHHGLVTNLYLPVSTPNTLGVNRSNANPAQNNFFFPGDSVTLIFEKPIRAIGGYFSSNPAAGTMHGFIIISTSLGNLASNGDPLPPGTFGFPANSLRFVGLISDVPFIQATIATSQLTPGNVGFVLDNLIIGE